MIFSLTWQIPFVVVAGMGLEGHLALGDFRSVGGSPDSTPLKLSVVQMGGAVKFVSTGYKHTCALLLNGAVRCWGKVERERAKRK